MTKSSYIKVTEALTIKVVPTSQSLHLQRALEWRPAGLAGIQRENPVMKQPRRLWWYLGTSESIMHYPGSLV